MDALSFRETCPMVRLPAPPPWDCHDTWVSASPYATAYTPPSPQFWEEWSCHLAVVSTPVFMHLHLQFAQVLCCGCLVPCFFFIMIFFSPQITHSQLTGRKVEAFHKNLNSSSCLSNNRIWILNLQYIYIL